MGDRELLELAAKAAGIDLYWAEDDPECDWVQGSYPRIPNHKVLEKWTWKIWNPLTEDGDAFRLAAKLGFDLKFGKSGKASLHKDGDWYGTATGPRCDDPAASMRRAIVRLAASQQDANEVHELVYKKSED